MMKNIPFDFKIDVKRIIEIENYIDINHMKIILRNLKIII